jgi:hypothetical protein
MPAPKRRAIVPAASSSVFLYHHKDSARVQSSRINRWIEWKMDMNLTQLISSENIASYARATALCGISSFSAYALDAFAYERSRLNTLIIPHGESADSLKKQIIKVLKSVEREAQVVLAAQDPKKAPLLWDFSRFMPGQVLSLHGGKDFFGAYIALASGLRGIAIENISDLKYVTSSDPRITSIAATPDQKVIALSFTVKKDKVKRPHLVPRIITLPCTCRVCPLWCPVHDEFGRTRNISSLPSLGMSRQRLRNIMHAWDSDHRATMHTNRRIVACHLAAFFSVFVGMDLTSFASASKLNYELDQCRRRLNTHFGWVFESESLLGYTVDAAQQMIQRQIFPGFLPLFDLFISGDLVSAVLQQTNRKFNMPQAIRDQPATSFNNWKVRYQRSSIAALADVKPSALEAFPNGLQVKDRSLAALEMQRQIVNDNLPAKGDIEKQLECFDPMKQASNRLNVNLEVADKTSQIGFGSASSSSSSFSESSSSSSTILTDQHVIGASFLPVPKRGPGRPRNQEALEQLFPNARDRSPRKKTARQQTDEIVAEFLPQYKHLIGAGFIKKGKPPANPKREDFKSDEFYNKYYAVRGVIQQQAQKLNASGSA